MTEDVEDLLERLVLKSTSFAKFWKIYDEEVGDSSAEVVLRVFNANVPKKGPCTLYVLKGGLTVVEDSHNKWSVYETRERVESNNYFRSWAEFCRAGWTTKIPNRAGTYPVRDCEGNRSHDRTLANINGRLVDVTRGGGFVPHGQVSTWRGSWWIMPYQPLLGEK